MNMLSGYVRADGILKGIDSYVVPPQTGEHAGVLGAIALAKVMSEEEVRGV
jgi:fructokinase